VKVFHLAIMGAAALALAACNVAAPLHQQGSAFKPWGGNYRLTWLPGTYAAQHQASGTQVQIRALSSREAALPGMVSGKNVSQWVIAIHSEEGDPLPLEPFTQADYESIELVNAPSTTQIECLEGGAIFICRTQPNTTVAFGTLAQDRVTTATGLFGVALHRGGFELTPLD